MDEKLSRFIVLAVTGVWVLSFLADIFLPDYEPSPFVQVAMMAVVGAATARYLYVKNGGGK